MQTFLYILVFACGIVLGGFVVKYFNPTDLIINGKNKVKRGGAIDYKLNTEKNGFFKRIIRRRKRMDADN